MISKGLNDKPRVFHEQVTQRLYRVSLAIRDYYNFSCHPTQVNAPCLTPARQAGSLVLVQPTPKGWKAELTEVVGYSKRGRLSE